jgi:hypothetical protein
MPSVRLVYHIPFTVSLTVFIDLEGLKGRHGCLWGNNIKMDLREAGFEGFYWIYIAQVMDRWQTSVSAAMELWVQ